MDDLLVPLLHLHVTTPAEYTVAKRLFFSIMSQSKKVSCLVAIFATSEFIERAQKQFRGSTVGVLWLHDPLPRFMALRQLWEDRGRLLVHQFDTATVWFTIVHGTHYWDRERADALYTAVTDLREADGAPAPLIDLSRTTAPPSERESLKTDIWRLSQLTLSDVVAPGAVFEAFFAAMPLAVTALSAADVYFVDFCYLWATPWFVIGTPDLVAPGTDDLGISGTIADYVQWKHACRAEPAFEVPQAAAMFRTIDTFLSLICPAARDSIHLFQETWTILARQYDVSPRLTLTAIAYLARQRIQMHHEERYRTHAVQFAVCARRALRVLERDAAVQPTGPSATGALPVKS